jgi:zinc protease
MGCGQVLRPADPDRRLQVKTSGSLFETDRGFQIAALPEEGSNVVWLDVRYPVGSADDPPGKAGLAHLVEHLLFDVEIVRGGRKTSIGAELGRIALSWNAATAADHTTYSTLIDPSALDEVIGLEVDRIAIGCAGLAQEIFQREREVVMNELRARQGASGAAIERALHEAVYPMNHPYRPVGSVESVARLELADACAFLAGPYHRGKAILVASAPVRRPSWWYRSSTSSGAIPSRTGPRSCSRGNRCCSACSWTRAAHPRS